MKYHRSYLLLILPFFLFGSTEKKLQKDSLVIHHSTVVTKSIGSEDLPRIAIGSTGTVEGNGGQRSVEIAVSLSQPPKNAVKILYHTANGSATAGSDYSAKNDSAVFEKGAVLTRLSVPIIGDLVVEPDESFRVVISKVIGAVVVESTDSVANVTIVNDDFRGGSGSGSGTNTSLGNDVIYEVRITHTGYTSFLGTPADCGIRPDGKVILTGLLRGHENVRSDDDMVYSGTLFMDMDMDICSVTGQDEASRCKIRVVGAGAVKSVLEVYYDGRGGYIKIEAAGTFLRSASGTCDAAQIAEERTMIPNKTIASIFNGRDLPMLTERTLRVGRFVETDVGNETVVEVLRVIRP